MSALAGAALRVTVTGPFPAAPAPDTHTLPPSGVLVSNPLTLYNAYEYAASGVAAAAERVHVTVKLPGLVPPIWALQMPDTGVYEAAAVIELRSVQLGPEPLDTTDAPDMNVEEEPFRSSRAVTSNTSSRSAPGVNEGVVNAVAPAALFHPRAPLASRVAVAPPPPGVVLLTAPLAVATPVALAASARRPLIVTLTVVALAAEPTKFRYVGAILSSRPTPYLLGLLLAIVGEKAVTVVFAARSTILLCPSMQALLLR
jgi:hypothetical protein